MARTEARLFTDIWADGDWCAAGPDARDTYSLLLTQDDLTHCGVLALREERWAEMACIPLGQLRANLARLESELGWVVIDRRAGELLVRSLIRRDKVLRQPKMWPSLLASMKPVRSVRVRAALLAELVRTRAEGEVNHAVTGPLDDLIKAMQVQLDTVPAAHLASVSDTHPGTHPDTHDGSHPGSLMGEGAMAEVSCSGAPPPKPLTPSPLPAAAAARPADDPAHTAGATAEGEGESLEALTAEVRRIRPEWSPGSVRRALTHPDVAARQPRSLIRSAALAVARDPETDHPGRLSRDGPWWVPRREAPAAAGDRPPWCGTCDERTRQTMADPPARCPACHPLTQTAREDPDAERP